MTRKSVCVDLDGVLAQYDGWKGVDYFGDPIRGAAAFTEALAEIADVVIFTTRCNPEVNKPEAVHLLVNRVRDWLDKHGFMYHHIYDGVGKPIASAYIDNKAIRVRPQLDGLWTDGLGRETLRLVAIEIESEKVEQQSDE